ncbi:MAG: hypothetical protein KDA93_09725 [Planctomycetaceae bacterium]|nr:hypothetical protein [Planctomycetaceae bacterium]
MSHPHRSESTDHRHQPEHSDLARMAIDVARLCTEWLNEEETFQKQFQQLLGRLSKESPFRNRAPAVNSSQLLQLTEQRQELRKQLSLCRSALGRLFDRDADQVQLTELEGLLSDATQFAFRERRLRVAELLEMNRKQLRSVEVKLSFSNVCVTTLLNDLLGQSGFPAGYGADGRQSVTAHDNTLHAVS